jgi:hypothetical protein
MSATAFGQIWQVSSTIMTFVDPARGNRQIETRIFYPADVGGTGMPLGSPNDKRFPLIVFGHDTDVDFANYSYLWQQLVNKGFFLAIPTTEMGPNPDVDELAKDMAFIASEFVVMRNTPGSFFFFRYNLRACMMGHGTGGTAATLAMQYYPLARTYISLAATETFPSAINAASMITKPSVVVGGGEDCVSPIASNQMLMFNNIDSDCKTFINLLNASHCNFAMNAGACTNTEILCTGNAAAYQNTNYSTTYLLISFLRYYMKDNAPALAKFEWKLASKNKDWTYIFSCVDANARIAFTEDEEESFERLAGESTLGMIVYPNPVISGSSFSVEIGTEDASGVRLLIHNMMGQPVWSREIAAEETMGRIEIPTHQMSRGNYVISVFSSEGRVSKPLVIQ